MHKRLLLNSVFLFPALLGAQEISTEQGWNLLGAKETLFISSIMQNSCVDTVWVYRNGKWVDQSAASIIGKGEGYWIKTPGSGCTISAQTFEEVRQQYESQGLRTYAVSIYDHGLMVSDGNEMTGTTKTMIGSVSKGFVGLLSARLAAKGSLDLDTPLSEYLSDSDTVELDRITNANTATLATCFNHVAGIYDYVNNSDSYSNDVTDQPNQVFTDALSITYAYDQEPTSEVGSYSYSNGGYDLGGLAIEAATDSTLSTLMQQEVTTPLGLSNTFFAKSQTSGVFAGTEDMDGDGTLDDVTAWRTLESGSASGGMVSTTEDLARYIVAVAQRDSSIIDSAVASQLDNHKVDTDSGDEYRLGLGVDTAQNLLSHEGSISGYQTTVQGYTDRSLGLTSNVAYIDGSNETLMGEMVTTLLQLLTE